MRFSTFIKQLPKSADSDITHFIKWVELKKNLPVSSDPRALGLFLANKLNEEQTLGYQKAMLLYAQAEKNMLPKDLKNKQALLDAVNVITDYQNNLI